MGIEELHQTVITDAEAQMSGDVETPWLELPEQASAPTLPADKACAQVYALAGSHRLYVKLSTGAIIDLTLAGSGPFKFMGEIGVPSDFPLPPGVGGVENGWTFKVVHDVTDNDPTRTNTGVSALAGSVLAWTGTTWIDIGEELTTGYIAVPGPVTLGDGDVLAMVDTFIIDGPCRVVLPPARAGRVGKSVIVVDVSGRCSGTRLINVEASGGDTINGGSVFFMNTPFAMREFRCVQIAAATYGWVTNEQRVSVPTSGGYQRSFSEVRQDVIGASTVIVMNIPDQAKVVGVQLRVDAAVTSGDGGTSWSAAFSGGSATVLALLAAFPRDTKVDKMIAGEVVSGITNITISCDGGTFNGGTIRAIAYYDEIVAMENS